MTIEFTAKDSAGNLFDTSSEEQAKKAGIFDPAKKYAPLTFRVGAGQVLTGLEEGVLGMRTGQSKRIVLPPHKAFGIKKPELISMVPVKVFEENKITLKKGMSIKLAQGTVKVLETDSEYVKLDANHPMAGQTLVFEVTLTGLEKAK